MSSDAAADTRRSTEPKLDSWKAIAAYLERRVRTAQRWEKTEGLPVHRHQHSSRGTVFAFPSEIDAWLEARTRSAPRPEELPAPAVQPDPGSVPIGVSAATPALSDQPAPAKRSKTAVVGGALLVALAAWFALWLAGLRESGPVGPARLLVLPLEALGSGEAEAGTARALHEELITALAGLAPERLAVIGRTSALRYGATGLSLAEIGDALGVDHVVEGSVRSRDGRMLVTLRLIRAEHETELWSESFELESGDVGAEEERVSAAACAAIASELDAVGVSLARAAFEDGPAREAWLRGRYLWHKGTQAGFEASLPHFEEALEHDPGFVPAHVGVANAYCLLGRYGSRPAKEVFPLGKAAALRALELDPRSAEAHAALALVHFYFEWDFEAAASEFRTALQLGPEHALTHHAYAHFLSCLGLHEEGLASVATARALEPLWPMVIADTAWFYFRARDFPEAIAASLRALELEPDHYSAVLCLVSSLEHQEEHGEAWSAMRSYLDRRGLLARIPGLADTTPERALATVRRWNRSEIERHAESRFVPAHSHVFSLLGVGRDAEALDWLESSLITRDRIALLTRVHPAFDRLRQEPRFEAVMEAVEFPVDPTAWLRAHER